jgi:hypothetical protein
MISTYLFIAQLAAGSVTYQDARALVGEHESTLSAEQGDALYKTQESAMNKAMPKCMDSVRPRESLRVSLVLSIGGDGRAAEAWTKQDSAFANCMKKELMAQRYIAPPKLPFYTSFDLDLGIKRAP